ncbi:Nramp-domain-containing protein [Amylostereum chailletii]|nr:Nramp-domain-containing protein [Amylostereum chailletii]
MLIPASFSRGNWSVDLQAGASFGYRPMLFVILMAGIGAIIFQSMACKLGCVTGLDLATHCRLLLYNRPRYTKLFRYGLLYPLYVLCEIAIISTDLAELLGSAIGLCLLFPALPLWAAVLVTAADVLVFLVIGDPTRGKGRPVRAFEWTVIGLVFAVLVCFIVLLAQVHASWPNVFLGFIPSKRLFMTKPNALYAAVGILGATVMPHALFLGSFLATQDRVSTPPAPMPHPTNTSARSSTRWSRFRSWFRSLFSITHSERIAADREHRNKYTYPENNTLDFVQAHLGHGLGDIVVSLLGVAVPINSAILIIAATVFFNREPSRTVNSASVGLFDAHDLIRAHLGKAPALIFAIALLCAGQTASITATLAGQIVSEGFIEWRFSPVLRRLITRLLGLIPSMAVAIAFGRDGIDTLLVVSQVILSIVLPVVVFPLVYFSSSPALMSVPKPPSPQTVYPSAPVGTEKEKAEVVIMEAPVIPAMCLDGEDARLPSIPEQTLQEEAAGVGEERTMDPREREDSRSGLIDFEETVDYSNGWALTTVGYLIWLLVVAANVYVIVELILGAATGTN